MDSRDWLIDAANPPLHDDELFTLPANISTSAIWPSLQDLRLPDQLLEPEPKTEDAVSDVTDAQLPPSPHPTPSLKPRLHISKPNPSFMPALRLSSPRAPRPPAKRPADDHSRQRHNQMMRENRGRFNAKFAQLTELLESLPASPHAKPMRNKIQILERAMLQYAVMESQRAAYKHQLLFPSPRPALGADILTAAPHLSEAAQLLVRHMCALHRWKYAEVWLSNPTTEHYTLEAAFVSPHNLPATRSALHKFARLARDDGLDPYIFKLALLRHPIWVSDLRTKNVRSARAQSATDLGVSTMLTVPLSSKPFLSGRPEAIIALFHADDDLLSFPGAVREYDRESVCRLSELCSTVSQARSQSS